MFFSLKGNDLVSLSAGWLTRIFRHRLGRRLSCESRAARMIQKAYPKLEFLESRINPSLVTLSSSNTYFQYDQIAKSGQNGLASIQPAVSINDLGQVAFIGSQTSGQSIYTGNGNSGPAIASFSTPNTNRNYGNEVQINNAGQISAVDSLSGSGTQFSTARIWNSVKPGTFTIVANASTPKLNNTYFDVIASAASISNDGREAFAGLNDTTWSVNQSSTHVNSGDASVVAISTPAFFRVKSANGGLTLIGNRQNSVTSIVLYSRAGATTIASTKNGWSSVGIRPAISNDGAIIVFEGQKTGSAHPGIWASITTGAGSERQLVQIAGQDIKSGAELGWTQTPNAADGSPKGNALFFSAFDADSQLGVYSLQSGPMKSGNSFTVSFTGTPNIASTTSPYQGVPFTAASGLWTEQVYLDKPISGNTAVVSPGIAIPVVQVGDLLGGLTIQSIGSTTGLGGATKDRKGVARANKTQGDRMLAFEATTATGQIVVRATHYDVTASQLRQVMPALTAAKSQAFVDPINRAMTQFGIVTVSRQAAFFAQVARESTELTVWQENLNYTTVAQLKAVFPTPFAGMTNQAISAYLKNPEKLANFVYASKNGNGAASTGDGYKYRGQGPIQITFKNTYNRFGRIIGFDLGSNPSYLSDYSNRPELGFLSSAAFFSITTATSNGYSGTLSQIADNVLANSSATIITNVNMAITKGVHGSTGDAVNRLPYFKKALTVLKTSTA